MFTRLHVYIRFDSWVPYQVIHQFVTPRDFATGDDAVVELPPDGRRLRQVMISVISVTADRRLLGVSPVLLRFVQTAEVYNR